MSGEIAQLSMDILPRESKRYKSIGRLTWSDIPGFAILTGKNGSGKTQLLEVLAYHFSGARPPDAGAQLPVEVHVTGSAYGADEIGYVPSGGRFSGGVPSSLANLPNVRNNALSIAQQGAHGYRHDIVASVRAHRIIKRLGDIRPQNIKPQMLPEIFSDDFEFAIDDIDITTGLTHLFMAYRLRKLESIERSTPGFDREGRPLGPAPWDVVNESLKVAGFPYEVISPEHTPLMNEYYLRLKDRQSGHEIAAPDLSSGEKVLLQIVLWLFTASKEGMFPKLLLLDEPDAHLHPSMTMQFLDVISEVLVNRHGVRVIMTTHSPSTVALAPKGSVFQLDRGAPEVVKVESRSDIVSILTAGL